MASYQPVTKEIVEQLEKIAPGRVYFGDDVNPDYGRDEMPIYGTRVVDGVDVGAYLLITFDGESEETLNPIIERAAELLLDQGALDVLVADSAPKRKEAWAARSSFLEGIEEQCKLLDECDVVVPVTQIPEYVVYADTLAKNYDFQLQYFGHAGDGNLHIYACSNDLEKDVFVQQVDDFMSKLYAKTMELGGQISGEQPL